MADEGGYRSDEVSPGSDEELLHRYVDVLRDKLKKARRVNDSLRDEARKAKAALAEHDPYTVSVFVTFAGDDARTLARTAKRDGVTVGELIQATTLRAVHDQGSDMDNDPMATMFDALLGHERR